MNTHPSHNTDTYTATHQRKRRWHRLVVCLAVVVAACTVYALMMPAITLAKPSHRHTESCYTQITSKQVSELSCTFAELHKDDTAYIVHRHDARCFDADGRLVCQLPEIEPHVHTEDCYAPAQAHVHTEDCYTQERGELICGEEESDSHQHTDSCYAWTKTLTCGFPEEPDASGDPVLICEKPEIILHAHTEECYGADGSLICTKPQVLEHQHTDDCFATVTVPVDTDTLTCTNQDPEHVHTALCYGTWELTCGLTEDPQQPADGAEDGDDVPDDSEPSNPDDDTLPPDGTDTDGSTDTDGEDTVGVGLNAFQLDYYVFIDGQAQLIKTDNSMRAKRSSDNRFYVTDEELEAVYGDYGFDRSTFNGELYFPHTDYDSPNTLWADAAPEKVTDSSTGITEWQILLSRRSQSYVYYLPANTPGSASYFNSSQSVSSADLIADNNFYSITISDPNNTDPSVNGVHYVRAGQKFYVELPALPEAFVWEIINSDTGAVLTPDSMDVGDDGSTFCVFNSVSCPIRIHAADNTTPPDELDCTIRYKADTLAANFQSISSEVPSTMQYVVTDGTVGGLTTLSETVSLSGSDTHTLREPDALKIAAGQRGKAQQDKRFYYHFVGWRAKSTNTLYPAGTPLTVAKLAPSEVGGVIELEAVWNVFDARNKVATVNFYVNLTCEIMDNHDNGFQAHPAENFTASISAASVYGTDQNELVQEGYMPIAPPTTEATAYAVDQQIRALSTTGYDGITLSDVPTDEEVFARLRAENYQITIENNVIPAQYLTTAHFQIRWYVLKYHGSDGWHIDGILVAKEAKLRVTKSFLGDPDSIARIKSQTEAEEYCITVEDSKDAEKNEDSYTLTLKPKAEETRENYIGYSSYDAGSDTYTWILDGHVDGHYTLRERNYLLSDAQTAAYYRVSEGTATAEWTAYDDDDVKNLQVRMQSYPNDKPEDEYQTVAFRNYYMKTGTLMLHKIDAFTNDTLAGVQFKISRIDTASGAAADMHLLRKPGTSMYTELASAGYTEQAGSEIITDQNGDIFLMLSEGSYVLEEAFPTGYSGASKIEFTVDASGQVTSLQSDGPSGIVTNTGTSMVIRNSSHLLTTVTAVKDWGPVPEDRQEPVVVTLLFNGTSLNDGQNIYTQTLSKDNNWTYVWEDLPLFIDGDVADYSLREIMIGSTAYEADANGDGYRDYAVTYDPAKFREGTSGDYTDQATWVDANGTRHFANHVLLTVHNLLDGNSGLIKVRKAFENADSSAVERLDGTYTFAVYDNPEGSGKPLQTASIIYQNGTVKPEDGIARFTGLTIGSTYYVFELDGSGQPVANGGAAVISDKPFTVWGSGAEVTVSLDAPTGECTITNRTAYAELPMTGGIGTDWLYLAGGLLSTGAAGLLIGKKRKKH